MPDLTGAASQAIEDVLGAPRQPVRLLAAFPTALYVELAGAPRVVALETRHGVGLPNAVVTDAGSWPDGTVQLAAGTAGSVGAGAVSVGPVQVAPDRVWDPLAALDLDQQVAERLGALADAVPDADGEHAHELRVRAGRLAASLAGRDAAATLGAAVSLVGLGPGLTPSGDDVLAGAIAAGRAAARARRHVADDTWLADLGAEVAAVAVGRTTSLSASLLWHAARGEMARPARHVLRALGGHTPLAPAIDSLVAVGHSSGRDLAAGMVLGLRAILGPLREWHDQISPDPTPAPQETS